MDSRTRRILVALDEYVKNPPPGTPEILLAAIEETKEMVEAPRYSEESPGERATREVAEENMPEDMVDNMYETDGLHEDASLALND